MGKGKEQNFIEIPIGQLDGVGSPGPSTGDLDHFSGRNLTSPLEESTMKGPNGRLPPLEQTATASLPKPSILKPVKPVLTKQQSSLSLHNPQRRGSEAASKRVSYIDPDDPDFYSLEPENKVMTYADIIKEINDFLTDIERDLNHFGFLGTIEWVGGILMDVVLALDCSMYGFTSATVLHVYMHPV